MTHGINVNVAELHYGHLSGYDRKARHSATLLMSCTSSKRNYALMHYCVSVLGRGIATVIRGGV